MECGFSEHLLSAKCPRFIATSSIELEVASLELKDPFLILIDSYDNAESVQTQRSLLSILRESLKDLSQKYPNDSEFSSMGRA